MRNTQTSIIIIVSTVVIVSAMNAYPEFETALYDFVDTNWIAITVFLAAFFGWAFWLLRKTKKQSKQ